MLGKFNFLFLIVVIVSGIVFVCSVYDVCWFYIVVDCVKNEVNWFELESQCLEVECYVQVINLCVEQVVVDWLKMCLIMLVVSQDVDDKWGVQL